MGKHYLPAALIAGIRKLLSPVVGQPIHPNVGVLKISHTFPPEMIKMIKNRFLI